MKKILGFLMLVLLARVAAAGVMGISQVPLLNITGTGNVRPNLMLLYDNSGSMAWSFTPDFVGNVGTTCRSGASLADGQRACMAGEPPYNSPDFNKQYYNPAIRYIPPVQADGTPYPTQDRTATTNWTSVTIDGFGKNLTDMSGNGVSGTKINLASNFPDLKWCSDNSGNTCTVRNTSTYAYPDATYQVYTANRTVVSPVVVGSNPYYYRINVAEYCTDKSLTTCKTTAVNAPAPAGYPEPAKVRWCDTPTLDGKCQAKYIDGQYVYPRFSNSGQSALQAYGTITIGASASSTSLTIASVTVTDTSGRATVITNGAVSAPSGTTSASLQATAATDLAYSIFAKSGLSNQYNACVNTPTGNNKLSVSACSSFGFKLGGDNMVAVIPLACAAGVTSKSRCTMLEDGSQSGWSVSVSAPSANVNPVQPATALVTAGGTVNANNVSLSSLKLGSTELLPRGLALSKGWGGTSVAQAIANAIGTSGTIKAYVGPNNASTVCKNASSNQVCLLNYNNVSAGQAVTVGTINNNTGSGRTTLQGTSSVAGLAVDAVPVSVTALGGGAAIFTRVDIVSGTTSYPRASTRTDCTGATSCSYDEEMTNFANWYAYYRTRNQMMKTAVGLAFQPLTQAYNVGIVSLSDAASTGSTNLMTLPAQFTGDVRTNWYSKLYNMSTTGSTPMRVALNEVGKMYANQGKYQQPAGSEVVFYPCQQNFTLITTDGYWNGNAAMITPAGQTTAVKLPDNDNVENPARFCTLATGCVDPRAEDPASLADVALYWYNGGSGNSVSSLRPSIDDLTKQGIVPAQSGQNTHLHMNTYALGLGVDGLMKYDPDYDTAPDNTGDFYRLITGASSGCPWNNGGAYVWPDPQTGSSGGGDSIQARVDDLWHAAINGHGKYFSASDPAAVVNGLNKALSNIQVTLGAASAAATSTPNISLADNDIFSATFTTVNWFGEITDRKIDPVTGNVGTDITWSSSNTLGRLTATDSNGVDGRTIYMLDTSKTGAFKSFLYSAMSDTEKAWFTSKCSQLSQCASLSTADRAIVDSGANLVNWLRGQQQYADDVRFRAYTKTTPTGGTPLPRVLGDVASAKPAYQREPRRNYPDTDYGTFRDDNATRKPYVFVAANDGMLHAFDASNGNETWAYAPRITMKKLFVQASTTYGTNHQFTVDGSPEIGDVKINGAWRSVLVAGLNGGGRGYYAIDVTDPENPAALWEICADSTVCSGNNLVPNLGLTFGNPQFGTWKDSAGTAHWVVFIASGYNNVPGVDNVSTGDGHGYLFVVDVATGQVLSSTRTGSVGDTSTPSNFAKITAISANPSTDPQVTYVYGGDNLGNMWRFDFTSPGDAPAPVLMGAAGDKQPITSRPDVTLCAVTTTDAQNNVSVTAQKYVAYGTGRMLDLPDISNTNLQSVYVLKDTGSGISTADWRAAGKMADRQLTKVTGSGPDTYTVAGDTVNLGTQLGWFFDLDQNRGERVNLDPQIVSGTLNVVTNIPSSSSDCSVGGTSNVYELNVCTGAAVQFSGTTGIAGGTLSNTSAAVGDIIVRLPSGALKLIATTADGGTVTKTVTPASSSAPRRAGWRQVGE